MVHLETKRQATHLMTGLLFAAVVFFLDKETAFAVLAVGAVGTFLFSALIHRGKHIPLFSKLVKKTEREGKPAASGVTWYFLGIITIFTAFYLYAGLAKHFVVAAMLIVAIGDSICTGLGRKKGKRKLPKTQTKSYVGSVIGFGVAFVAAALLFSQLYAFWLAVAIAFFGAFAGMLAEAYLVRVNDNLSIPLVSCCVMVLTAAILGVL